VRLGLVPVVLHFGVRHSAASSDGSLEFSRISSVCFDSDRLRGSLSRMESFEIKTPVLIGPNNDKMLFNP
jgi:hypothetical protein